MYLLEMFGISLLLTLILEIPLAWLMGIRGKRETVLMILVNILTNPAAVLLCWLGAAQLPVEMGVILAEGAVYYLFSREKGWKIPHPVLLSVVCNTVSWTTGMLIQSIGGRL